MVTRFPRPLFPAVGLVVLGGAETAGALLAAFAARALVLSGGLGDVHRHGRAITGAIVAWAASISAFGVVLLLAPPVDGAAAGEGLPWRSPWLWAALVTLAAAGAADSVSAIFRTTVLQLAAPDSSRGLLAGVFIVVVAGGPRLGEAASGALAGLVGEAVVPLVGGLVCITVVALLGRRSRAFWDYDARTTVP